MTTTKLLTGLIAATHTPFNDDGSLKLETIERQAEHLLKHQIRTVFIGGSTGESHSLSLGERQSLATRWSEVARGTELQIVVHVGANCLSDSRTLAEQAQKLGAIAISALAPSYFKPKSISCLVACMAEIASAAPSTPFYFYDIPVLTNVHFSMPDFLDFAKDRIATLTGIKFTNSDLMSYQLCLRADAGRWDIPFGCDEFLLAALVLGAQGAVGSSYNFAAPVYHRIMAELNRGNIVGAKDAQFQSVQLIQVLASFNYMGAAKALMEMMGVLVGPPRLPNECLTVQQKKSLQSKLDNIDFFNWVKL